MKQIKIDHPTPSTHIPAHEQAARERREHTEHLPAVPGNRSMPEAKAPVAPNYSTWYRPFAGGTCEY